jgi:hypothetical protein
MTERRGPVLARSLLAGELLAALMGDGEVHPSELLANSDRISSVIRLATDNGSRAVVRSDQLIPLPGGSKRAEQLALGDLVVVSIDGALYREPITDLEALGDYPVQKMHLEGCCAVSLDRYRYVFVGG